jgi:lipocalin
MNGVKTEWGQILGVWYEWMRIPSWFEPPSMEYVTAEYRLTPDKSHIQIVNRGINLLGLPQQSFGKAVVDSSRLGVLKVTFFEPFTSDYIVLNHKFQSDYDILIVGSNDKKLLWLLTRKPLPPNKSFFAQLQQHVINTALQFGYSPTTLQQLQITPRPFH